MSGREPESTLVCAGVFTGLAIIFSALRLYSRVIIIRAVRVDDVLLGFAMMCSVALTVITILRTLQPLGLIECCIY